MNSTRFLANPTWFALPWEGEAMPVGIVDLDSAEAEIGTFHQPPFPLLGIGNPAHPLARRMDALIEPPMRISAVVDKICAQPLAAQVVVQLLRLIETLDMASALVAESLAYAMLQGSAGHEGWLALQKPSPPQLAGEVRLSRMDNTLEILIDRPCALNAIDRNLRDSLREAFTLAALDDEIERVVLRGAGRAFSVGADLSEFGTTRVRKG